LFEGYKVRSPIPVVSSAHPWLCDRCVQCLSPFPRSRASSECHRRLAWRMGSQCYLPPNTGEPIPALYRGGWPDLLILLPLPSQRWNRYQFVLRGEQRHTCVNNLPKVVTWQCPVPESNLQP